VSIEFSANPPSVAGLLGSGRCSDVNVHARCRAPCASPGREQPSVPRESPSRRQDLEPHDRDADGRMPWFIEPPTNNAVAANALVRGARTAETGHARAWAGRDGVKRRRDRLLAHHCGLNTLDPRSLGANRVCPLVLRPKIGLAAVTRSEHSASLARRRTQPLLPLLAPRHVPMRFTRCTASA